MTDNKNNRDPMPKKKGTLSQATVFRIIAIILGSILLGLGWTAHSEGNFWIAGYNAQIGKRTTGPTLAWVVYGVILLIAGIFPWKWLSNRRKR